MLDLKNKKIYVFGLGISGRSAALFLAKNGASLIVNDIKKDERFAEKLGSAAKNGVEFVWGEHPCGLAECDIVIKSPGISLKLDVFKEVRRKNIPVWTDIELAGYFLNSRNITAVTGTNGKSTVSALTAHILRGQFENTILAGNIGLPVCDVIPLEDPDSPVVLEVSSYQLECAENFAARIGVLTNITPDHLGHHGGMEEYISAKLKLFDNHQGSCYAVVNYDDNITRDAAKKIKNRDIIFFSVSGKAKQGIFFERGSIISRIPGFEIEITPRLKIFGVHNLQNALCSAACALLMGIKKEQLIIGLESFSGLEHRLEHAGSVKGVAFVNDSKSTNVESAITALKAFDSKNIRLILGGEDKGFSYAPLKELVKNKVKAVYLIGSAAPLIRDGLGPIAEFHESGDLKTAVIEAYNNSIQGDIVLLSPACASFDQFENFEQRGRCFKEVVNKLNQHG